MSAPLFVDTLVPELFPGVRVLGDWAGPQGVALYIADHERGIYSALPLDRAEAERLAASGSGPFSDWICRQVRTLLDNHRQPINQMRPWADRLPLVDAATYLGVTR